MIYTIVGVVVVLGVMFLVWGSAGNKSGKIQKKVEYDIERFEAIERRVGINPEQYDI